MGITGADSNTGLSPIDWGSWETTWTGSSVDTGPTLFSRTDTEVTGRSSQRGSFQRGSHIPLGRGIPITTTTNFLDTTFNFREQTTTTTTNQTREGIQFRVGERFDTTSLGIGCKHRSYPQCDQEILSLLLEDLAQYKTISILR